MDDVGFIKPGLVLAPNQVGRLTTLLMHLVDMLDRSTEDILFDADNRSGVVEQLVSWLEGSQFVGRRGDFGLEM